MERNLYIPWYFPGRVGAAAAGDAHLDLLRSHIQQVFRHHCIAFEKDGTFLHTSTATGRVRKSSNMRACQSMATLRAGTLSRPRMMHPSRSSMNCLKMNSQYFSRMICARQKNTCRNADLLYLCLGRSCNARQLSLRGSAGKKFGV